MQPFSLSCPAQGSPVPSYRFVISLIFGTVSQYRTAQGSCVNLLLSISNMHWRVFTTLEPIGGSVPKFSMVTESFTLTKAAAHPFSLSCPAQGSPVPSYRFEFCHFALFMKIKWLYYRQNLLKSQH